MARLTGSCTGGWGSRYNYYLDYTLNSQSVANNTSNITLTAWAKASASNYVAHSTNANPYSIYIDGTNKVSSTKAMDFRNMAVVSLGSWTGNVSHGSDGKKTINIGGKFTISGTSSLSGGTVSGNWVLPTIARASTPTLSASHINIESPVTIYTNRASTSFTHSIEVYFGSWSATVATGVTVSQAWTLPTALANQIPSSSSGTGIIRLVTYNGTTHIGNKDIVFTAYVPTESPTFNPTATGLSVGIYGSGRDKTIGKYIQGVSRVSASFTPATNGGASISSQTITVNGVAYNGKSITSNVIGSSGTITISAKVVDSRGRSASTSTTISVDAYAKPSISSFSAVRVVNTSNVNIIRNGSFSYLGGSNPLTLTIEQQTVGISTWTSVESTNGGTTGSFNGSKTVTGLSDSSSYNFRITIADTFGNKATSSSSVGTSIVPMSWSKTGVGAGKIWERGALDVGGRIYASDTVVIKGTENPLAMNGSGVGISNACYMTFLDSASTRQGYIGYATANDNNIYYSNEVGGGGHVFGGHTIFNGFMRIQGATDSPLRLYGNGVGTSNTNYIGLYDSAGTRQAYFGKASGGGDTAMYVVNELGGPIYLGCNQVQASDNMRIQNNLEVNGAFDRLTNWDSQITGNAYVWHVHVQASATPVVLLGWTNSTGAYNTATIGNWSKREIKEQVRVYDYDLAYGQIRDMNIYSYKLIEGEDVEEDMRLPNMRKLGVMLDEAPFEVQDSSNDEPSIIDTYGLASLAIAGLKGTQEKLEQAEERILDLEIKLASVMSRLEDLEMRG